jgi:hypothetical protein
MGIVRYRFALAFVARGLLSAINQYHKEKATDTKFNAYWQIINAILIGVVFFSVLIDVSKGQIYPKYPELPILVSLVCAGIGYGFILLLHVKIGSLFQRMSGGVIFTVCPNCGYANIKVVETCINCSYKKNMPLVNYKEKEEIPEDLKDKIKQYNSAGLYKKPPESLIKGLNLEHDESILISIKAPSLKLGTIIKNGSRSVVNTYGEICPLNRVILTTKRICFLTEISGGWKEISCHPLNGITRIRTENKRFYSPLMDEVDKMILDIGSDEYILSGFNPQKLFNAISNRDRKRNLNDNFEKCGA